MGGLRGWVLDADGPVNAKPVHQHSKEGREKGFVEGHLNGSPLGESSENLLRFRLGPRSDGEPESLEDGVAPAPAVRGLEPQDEENLGSQSPAVEFEGLFAAAVEVEVVFNFAHLDGGGRGG